MYSAMIVEDEILVRHGIKSMLDWGAAEIGTVYEASNGAEALELYAQNRPDIILTDLKMPVMDGISLIKAIREQDAQTRFVIMSCLDEFALVQQALNYGVSHYFLKVTASCEDIQAVLSRITQELRETALREESGAFGRAEAYFQGLLEGMPASREASAAAFATLGHDPEDPYAVAVLQVVPHQQEGIPVAQALARLREGSMPRLLRLSSGQYASLLPQADLANAASLCERLSREADVRAQLGLSRPAQGLAQLPGTLRQALHALDGCFFSGETCAQWDSSDGFALPDAEIAHLLEPLGSFMHLPGSFVDAYEAKIHQLSQQRYAAPDAFRGALCALVVWLSVQADCASTPLEMAGTDCIRRMSQSPSLSGVIAQFVQFAIETLGLSSFSEKMPESITSALLYINANLDQPLTLNEIAGHTHLNPSYLSTLFHKVMRLNLVTYINSLRIERAKALLRNTHLPIGQIALTVGFSQDIYFYRLFKRSAGQTPSEYRTRYQAAD